MSTKPCGSVVKAFQVLDLFRAQQVLGAADCARALGIPKASAHRMLVTLRECGAVESTSDGHYRLALAMFELGSLVPVRRFYRHLSQVPLKELCNAVRLPVHLAIREDTHLVYVKKASLGVGSRHGDSGQRGHLHASAAGKVLLAFAGSDVVTSVVAHGLRKITPVTISDATVLARTLDDIRAKGYATEQDETILGLAAVAVPIHSELGDVVASMSVCGPRDGVIPRVADLLADLRRTARQVENRLRGRTGGVAVQAIAS